MTRDTAGPVKTRSEKARETRLRMLEAAKQLFGQSGYASTKIEAIAREAGVAVQTIYFTFGNKRAILKELLDLAVAGDAEPIPTLERPWVREALTAAPDEQLRIQVAASREIYGRVAPVLEIVRGAAAADPEVAELWRINRDQRHTVQAHLVTALAAKGALRETLTLTRAIDIAYSLLSPEIYQLLVFERGWPAQEWEAFTLRALICELLEPGTGK
ncbi:helix-turn-helix domain-containing protein [Actinocrispum sp. NPDC049592]|uniref:TetR/AcrR family transcriptional regulator n=1 Tax=Actinocrispum sp. NPDC049592 TaxID=3154835 RepID=UPI003439A71E